jgi:[ribosomal protein S5]-alanine N-acetyltransferase
MGECAVASGISGMPAPQRLETARLILRKPVLDDAHEIYHRYAADAEVTRFLAWPRHRSVADSRAFVEFSDAQWHDRAVGPYLIESLDGRLLGGTGLELQSSDCASTGYVLSRDSWGRGYASEALRAIIEVTRQLSIRELYAICHAEHAASQRVLEKCGFDRRARLVVDFPNLPAGEARAAVRYGLTLS